jgi:hypothetical protein
MTVEQLFMSFPFLHWAHYLTVSRVSEIPGLRAAFEASRFGERPRPLPRRVPSLSDRAVRHRLTPRPFASIT